MDDESKATAEDPVPTGPRSPRLIAVGTNGEGPTSGTDPVMSVLGANRVVAWHGEGWRCGPAPGGWRSPGRGTKVKVSVNAQDEHQASRVAQRVLPDCCAVQAEREAMARWDAQLQLHLRRAVDAWAEEVAESHDLAWQDCWMVLIDYNIRGRKRVADD